MIPYVKWLRETINVDEEIVLFVERQKSHMTLELSRVCREIKVVLIGLHQNLTQIVQPLSYCIKEKYEMLVDQWTLEEENEGKSFDIEDMAKIIEQSTIEVLKTEAIKDAFEKTGIFPWNADNIDFSRCIGKNLEGSQFFLDVDLKLEIQSKSAEVVKEPAVVPGASAAKVLEAFKFLQSVDFSVFDSQTTAELLIANNETTSIVNQKLFSNLTETPASIIQESVEVIELQDFIKTEEYK